MTDAFPGLVGLVIGRTELNEFGEGACEQLGIVVGWTQGYLMVLADGGRLEKVDPEDPSLIVMGPGKVERAHKDVVLRGDDAAPS